MKEAFRLLIGSVGDDSHSIGMYLLESTFREYGFYTRNIGILNGLDDFFSLADDFDAIFISCMNGHANLYFEDFPLKLQAFKKRNSSPKVWYLGGNLSVQELLETVVRKYRRMGFDFVSPKPISCKAIAERLLKDLHRKNIKKKSFDPLPQSRTSRSLPLDTVNDEPLTDREFLSTRQEVLDSWPTGGGVRDADIASNHSRKNKNLHYIIYRSMVNGGRPLVQPRTGVAHTCDEIEILRFLRKNGLDVSSIQLDAASRKNLYDRAREGILRTERGKNSFLNGYPVPVHGVKGIEEIVEAIDTPFQIRAGSPDHRLVYEIGLAGGVSSLEGGFLCYLFPYDKYLSPLESLELWKYIDKLAAWYRSHFGVIINREYFGPLTCCLIEPAVPICINIIESLLSARSGVKCISVGLAEQGNRSQDIAAVRVLEKTVRFYLDKYGFSDCTVSTVYHQFMAAFPTDPEKAGDLIVNSAITGTLARANRIMTKTPVEAMHIPSKFDNAEGLSLTHKGILAAGDVHINKDSVIREMQWLEREVGAIMDAVESMGGGSIARGAIRAFERGILDIPFSPSIFNQNRLMTARDCDGAVRFVNPEHLPFEGEIIDFHKEKIHRRLTMQGTSKIFEIVEKDLTRILNNDYLRWPLDGHYLY